MTGYLAAHNSRALAAMAKGLLPGGSPMNPVQINGT
jgi:hypothetical protein